VQPHAAHAEKEYFRAFCVFFYKEQTVARSAALGLKGSAWEYRGEKTQNGGI
jgi:hypothetical protein